MKCLLCLQTTNSVFNIFEGLKEGFVKLDTPGIIEKYIHFKPDKFNSMLCDKCWNTIESFHIFCLQIEEAHKNYRETKIDIEIVKNEHVLLDSEDNYFTDNVDIVENTLNEIIKTEYSESYTNVSLPGCTTTNYKTEESLPNQYALYKTTKNNSKIKVKKLKSSTEYEDYKCNDIQSTNNFKMKYRNKKRKRIISKIMADAADEKIAKYMTLSCQLCSETLPTLAALKSHYLVIHKQKGYAICCNKKFFRRNFLVDHIECHLNPAHFKCSLCDTTFTRSGSLKRHMKVIHEEADKEVCYSYCDQCPKKFIDKKNLARHKAYHLPAESWKFPCEECGKIFPHEFYLLSHKRLVHNPTPKKMCDICGKIVSAMLYKNHMQRHDSNNYKAVKAVKSVKSKSVKIKCHICNSYLSKIYMKVHLKNHEEANKDHICPTCGLRSPNGKALYMHIYKVHRTRKAHPCIVCKKLFRSKDLLLQHIPFHTGEKKFECTVCNSLFKFNSNLYEHKKREHPIEYEEERENRKKKLLENCITIENN